ncbi:MAG: ATPase [Bacteroidaceae bacterium]|nr:ATPase [Bacteroidaceae bacterium]
MTNKVLLIADSGSTKTDWLITKPDGEHFELHTDGINPARDTRDYIYNVVYHQLLSLIPQTIELQAVYFYGAGCIEPFSQTVQNVIKELFARCQVEVKSDLLGAARALCGNEPGIACILGTGSNSCLYDGKDIVMHTPPLGYILGDEGSGSFLGKTLLNGLFKGTLPKTLKDDFCSKYNTTMSGIIERIYRQPAANTFLASLVPFIVERRSSFAIHKMLVDAFRLFIERNIAVYGHKTMPINCVGGIAYQFEEELKEAAEVEGMQIGRILRRPIDEIVQYHLREQ